jgi:hypothetical protein
MSPRKRAPRTLKEINEAKRIKAMDWHETYDNVTRLGRWLTTEWNVTATELQDYYESPWHWTDEYQLMEESDAPKNDRNCDRRVIKID